MASSKVMRQSVRRFSFNDIYNYRKIPDEESYKHAEKAAKLWGRLTCFVALPSVVITAAYVYMNHHEHPRPEFIPYDHLRIRTKKFPWGDGNHTLFHNPRVNALPTGYED